MRAVAIGILALLCGACAAGRQFDLVPRDPESPWLPGPQQVRVESSNATIDASYDGLWFDHLAFMVEVVNHTDSLLVVDPQRFTLTLVVTGMPYGGEQGITAVDPAAIIPVPYGAPERVCPCFGPCRWVYPTMRPDEATLLRLLHRIELEPGRSVRGEVWMPSWLLRQAIERSEYDAPTVPADYEVTLHTPRELGGQEVGFSVAVR